MPEDGGPYWLLARRVAWAATVVWLTLTACFLVIWSLPAQRAIGFSTVPMGLEAVGAARETALGSYLAWMRLFLTLDWGRSVYFERPVTTLYRNRLPVTLAYLVPSMVVSVVAGTGVATYAATDRTSYLHRTVSGVAALGMSAPSFVMAVLFYAYYPRTLGWVYIYNPELGLWHPQNLLRLQILGVMVGLSFTAVQVRHAQSETLERLGSEFVKVVRAKGADRLRVARHVFRNAWPSMASLVQGEALGIIVLSTVVVEYAFTIESGMAYTLFYGFAAGDPMLIFTAVFGIVVLGVTATLARDLARVAFDPRYDDR